MEPQSLPFLGCPVCPPHEPFAHPSCDMVTQLDEDKLSPPVPLNPQGCDSRAPTTHSPARTPCPLHPRAAQCHQGEAHTTSWVYSLLFSPPRHAGLLKDLIYKGNMDIASWKASEDCKALAGQNTQPQRPQCHKNKLLLKCSGSDTVVEHERFCSSCSVAAQNCVGPHTPLPQKKPSWAGGLSVLGHCVSLMPESSGK